MKEKNKKERIKKVRKQAKQAELKNGQGVVMTPLDSEQNRVGGVHA